MIKPRGAICNLDCAYCYFLKKEPLYPGSDFYMPDDVLESYVRQYIAAQKASEVTFAWQGGEPTLMGVDFYRRAVRFQEKHRQPGMRIRNTLQTNGTLLDEEWCRLFREHQFLIGLSIDGPRRMHDRYRYDKGKQPTFEAVLKGLHLLKKHRVEFNILACVSASNVEHPLAVYRFLRDAIGARFIQFIPIVERENASGFQEGDTLTSRSISGKQYGDFLIAVFDDWLPRDVGKIFVQLFDAALGKWLRAPGGLCIFEETCGLALAIEHNGDLYSCDHYVEPDHRLGNILAADLIDLVGSNNQRAFGEAKRDALPRYCRECVVRFACNGGCPKNRVAYTPGGEPGLNHLCEGYRAFFRHIDPVMKNMARLIREENPRRL